MLSRLFPIRLVNVSEDHSEASHRRRGNSICTRHEEQVLGQPAVYRSKQAQRAESAKYRAVGRIVEEHRETALWAARRRSLRQARPRRGGLRAACVQEAVKGCKRICRHIRASAIPIDFAPTAG